MKKKKIKLQFDKKVISNLTKIRGGGAFFTITHIECIPPDIPDGSGTCFWGCTFIDRSIGDC